MTEQANGSNRETARRSKADWLIPPPAVIWILAIALGALLVYVSRDLLLLLFLSAALAYLLNPIVNIAESVLIKRQVAVAAVYLTIGVGMVGAGYFLHPRLSAEIETLTRNLPSFGERLDLAIEALQNEITERYPDANRFLTTREFRYEELNRFVDQQAKNLPALVSHLASLLLAAVLVPFFSYFFLRDSRKMLHFFLDRLPANTIETSVAIWREIDRAVGHYLRGVALEGFALGAIAALGLWLLGVNYPLLLGAVSGIASVVPYLGPIVGGASAVLVALIQFKSLAAIVKVVALYLCIKLLDLVVIQPLAVGHGKALYPALLIGSILVGGHALGIIGMIIAVPTVTIVQRIVQLLVDRRHASRRRLAYDRQADTPLPPIVC